MLYTSTSNRHQKTKGSSHLATDVVYVALKTLCTVSDACPFPPFLCVAQLALDLWDNIERVRQNKVEFRDLVYMAGDIIRTVSDEVNTQVTISGMEITEEHQRQIQKLESVVKSIHDLLCEHVGRGILRRLFRSNNDLSMIAEYRRKLEEARKNFQIGEIVSTRAGVDRIEMQQVESMKDIRELKDISRGSSHAPVFTFNNGKGTVNTVFGSQHNRTRYHVANGNVIYKEHTTTTYPPDPSDETFDDVRRQHVMKATNKAYARWMRKQARAERW